MRSILDGHDHRHGASYPGTVVLELGTGAGALIVHAGPDQRGREIEIVPLGPSGAATHAEVRERRLPGGTLYCAVLSRVAPGEYTLGYAGEPPTPGGLPGRGASPGARPASTVTVQEGRVSEVRWPGPA